MKRAAAILSIGLAACVAPRASDPLPDAKWSAFERHMTAAEERFKAGKITRHQLAMEALQQINAISMNDPYLEEMWAYRAMLAGRVDRNEMSEDEARYLDTKKANEIIERVESQARRPSRPAAAPFDGAAFRAAQQRDAERQRVYQEMLRPGLEGARTSPPVTCRPSIMGNMVCQ